MTVILQLLVWLGVAVELICCAGLVAVRTPIDRLHYAGAATVVGPALVAAAVCVEEGLFTTSGLNAIVATARAIRLRERGTLESNAAERERGS
jgi:hypothetical protein